MSKINQKANIYLYIMLIITCVQIVCLIYVNLTQIKYHMGYDASSYLLKAAEMHRQGTFFIDKWTNQTTLYLDSAVPLAALLMNIFNDVFIAYGIADIIIDALILTILWLIFGKLNISYLIRFLILNVAMCPYIAIDFNNVNDVGYFSSTLTSGSWYGFKLFLSLLFLYDWLVLNRDLKLTQGKIIVLCVTVLLYFISGISSGYYLAVTILLPAFFCGIMECLWKNQYKKLFTKKMIFVYLNIIAIVIGKYISLNIIKFTSSDSTRVLVSLSAFFSNFTSIFLGLIGLINGLPNESNQQALSWSGFVYLGNFFLAVVAMVSFICCIVYIIVKRKICQGYTIFPMVALTNIAMFALLFTTYSGDVFERRYWIIPFFCLLICMGLCLNKLDLQKIFSKGLLLLLSLITVVQVGNSYKIYNNSRLDLKSYDEVKEQVEAIDSPVVYFYGDQYGIFARNMRVYDTSKIYKILSVNENGEKSIYHWGDYTYYDYIEEWQGKVILITDEESFKMLPDTITDSMKLYNESSIGNIYEAEKNVLGK